MTLYHAPEDNMSSDIQQDESHPTPGATETFDVIECSDATRAPVPASNVKKSNRSRRVSKDSSREIESDSSSDERDETPELPSSDGPSIDEDSNNSTNSVGSVPVPRRGSGIPKTAYELQREERLKRNNELLKELGLDGNSVNELFLTKKNEARSNRQEKEGPAGPTRRSSRISSSVTASHATSIDDPGDNLNVSSSVANHPNDSPLHLTSALSPVTPSVDLSHGEDTAFLNAAGDSEVQEQSRTETGQDGSSVGQAHCPPKEGKKNPSSTIRQAGVEILVPLGVRSTDHEQFLEERQRMLEETDLTTSRPLALLPPGGLDGDLFPVFDLQDIKSPELRSQAEWISEAELLLCDTFKSSGTFPKLAVRYWLKIEEKLGYPGSVSLSSVHSY